MMTTTTDEAIADITALSATEMAEQIAIGALSSSEVVEAHLRRIEEVNPLINAVVVPLFEQARKEAEAADTARARGESLGPLHGVPITIKESFDVMGTPTTMGLSARVNQLAESDGLMIARLRAAGAIILGKTNVPQMVLYNEADNPVYGRTVNPWNKERAPGGSSGGCAAIIAAHGSPLSLGSDIGGSVRLPANACGIHSFKPTSGRLTMLGHAAIFAGMEAILAQPGPLARSVADLSLALNLLAAPGQEAFDPSIAPVALRETPRELPVGLRVAMFTDNGFFQAAPALRRAVREAADALRARGVTVDEWQPPDVSEAWRLYLGLAFGDGMSAVRRELKGSKLDWRMRGIAWSGALPKILYKLSAWQWALLGQKRISRDIRGIGSTSTKAYWQLVDERTRYRAAFIQALDAGRYDAIICPPDGLPALRHGSSFFLTNALSYTMLFNLLGMPAGVVAATRVRADEESDREPGLDIVERMARKVETGSAGLPVGVQVAARHWREDVALSIMLALEEHFKAQPDYPANPPL
ncbi:MAG TPA: amidase [Pyrinomonadaceae bacterium]|jgi:fatty acid amide hydrolase